MSEPISARFDAQRYSVFSYRELRTLRSKAFRNGNWWKLERVERGLFNAAMALAKMRTRIVNPSLVDKIKGIVYLILQTFSDSLLRKGKEKAERLWDLYSRNGVFGWLPQMRELLKDPSYLTWLGLFTMNHEAV